MKPIEFEVEQTILDSPKVICQKVIDVANWSDFNGYGILPGIEKAVYEVQTDEITGSRIRVHNSDGSEHIEEILEYQLGKRIVMKLHEFPTALSFIATHFIEEWTFEKKGKNETLVKRKFRLFSTSFLSRPVLSQISSLMQKATKNHLETMAAEMKKD